MPYCVCVCEDDDFVGFEGGGDDAGFGPGREAGIVGVGVDEFVVVPMEFGCAVLVLELGIKLSWAEQELTIHVVVQQTRSGW